MALKEHGRQERDLREEVRQHQKRLDAATSRAAEVEKQNEGLTGALEQSREEATAALAAADEKEKAAAEAVRELRAERGRFDAALEEQRAQAALSLSEAKAEAAKQLSESAWEWQRQVLERELQREGGGSQEADAKRAEWIKQGTADANEDSQSRIEEKIPDADIWADLCHTLQECRTAHETPAWLPDLFAQPLAGGKEGMAERATCKLCMKELTAVNMWLGDFNTWAKVGVPVHKGDESEAGHKPIMVRDIITALRKLFSRYSDRGDSAIVVSTAQGKVIKTAGGRNILKPPTPKANIYAPEEVLYSNKWFYIGSSQASEESLQSTLDEAWSKEDPLSPTPENIVEEVIVWVHDMQKWIKVPVPNFGGWSRPGGRESHCVVHLKKCLMKVLEERGLGTADSIPTTRIWRCSGGATAVAIEPPLKPNTVIAAHLSYYACLDQLVTVKTIDVESKSPKTYSIVADWESEWMDDFGPN
ncbi:unnamed protein product [Prorocentrum cordatum]|nr:unnamed protein product [Polarella glacialis]